MTSETGHAMAIKSLHARFQHVNVQSDSEALKLVRDVDEAAPDKDDAFLIYKTMLWMPAVLTRCEDMMRVVRRQRAVHQRWEPFAERARENVRGRLKATIDLLQKKIADAEIKIGESQRVLRRGRPEEEGKEDAHKIARGSPLLSPGYRDKLQ